MVVYNFKKIEPVPTGKDFIDIVLSKTQRKTPTVIHPGYKISRIRSFYMRKVKFTQQVIHDKLSQIIQGFPLLDDVHPFYSDLMNVLYDKDHYKLALGQLNTARHLVDNVAKDYARLLKYGDSLFRCKQLKRAALGRMCTILKKQASSLGYLEQVRQHLARLPSIDPNTRTLLLCGYPNVGKSSFMNKVTRANVEVQPYAFTTKSLFVGHMDYKYVRWQVIDTPGILDHPLEERNTIEMQSITALAHLRAAVLYIVDISEQCGYSIKQQVSLFHSIKPLFANKPVFVIMNKIDVIRPESLTQEETELINSLSDSNVQTLQMSTLSDEGIPEVKTKACDVLLSQRVEQKAVSKDMKGILNRLHVAVPQPRDDKPRPASIPETVFAARAGEMTKVDMDKETNSFIRPEDDPDWDPTVFEQDYRVHYKLKNDDWKYDPIPEIVDGKNVADFVDPDIMEMLERLEKEEEEREIRLMEEEQPEEIYQLDEADIQTLNQIREAKALRRLEHSVERGKNAPPLPRKFQANNITDFESTLQELGINPEKAIERVRGRSRSRERSRVRLSDMDGADVDGDDTQVGEKRGRSQTRSVSRSKSRERSRSKTPSEMGLSGEKQKELVDRLIRKSQKKRNKMAKVGEADRTIPTTMPKHLFSGKRKKGKADRR
jgi:nucleolar GTP-binding protein